MNASTSLSKTLLFLYECLSDPQHTELMIETIGQWLSDEDNELHFSDLEEHSQNVLKLLENQIKSDQSPSNSQTAPDLEIPFTKNHVDTLAAITVALGGVIADETGQKLDVFLCSKDQNILFKYTTITGETHLCLMVRDSNLNHLRLWFNEQQLHGSIEALMKSDLGLSHSEFMVIHEIARGGKTTQIAQRLGKSPETIKSQLKSIAVKLGTSGQQQIQAQINRLEKFVASAGIEHKEKTTPQSAQFKLPDGRTLAYSIYGPMNGRPVLFFHCFLHGRHLPQDIAPYLAKNNIKIISMSRAGFGGSTLNTAQDTDRLSQNTSDYVALVNHLGLGPLRLFSHATGFASAFHFALHYPELSLGIIGLDAVPPANSRDRIGHLIGLFKSTSLAMSKAPATFNLMTRFVFSRLASFQKPGKKMRRHILYPSIPLDELETDAGLNAATANVHDLMQNQLHQCVQEARIFRQDWAHMSSDINTKPRVRLYHTRDNPFVAMSGSNDLADTLGCDVTPLGTTFPFLTPHMKNLFDDPKETP